MYISLLSLFSAYNNSIIFIPKVTFFLLFSSKFDTSYSTKVIFGLLINIYYFEYEKNRLASEIIGALRMIT